MNDMSNAVVPDKFNRRRHTSLSCLWNDKAS
jgi:hypothetical protein